MSSHLPSRNSALDRLDVAAPEQRSGHQRHSTAPPDIVWPELTALTLADLRITRPLVALRHLGTPPPTDRPLLREGPLQMLEERSDHAIGGAVARPWRLRAPRRSVADLAELIAFDEPGWTKYVTEFAVASDGGTGSVITTRTWCWSTDGRARRRFAAYWALIRAGSGLVRRDVLSSAARRAEARAESPG